MSKINSIKTTIETTLGIIALIVAVIGIIHAIKEISNENEKKACEMVSNILKENEIETTCKEVVFKEHPTDFYWKGEAFLSNVRSVQIEFMKNDDSVYVRIPDLNPHDLE